MPRSPWPLRLIDNISDWSGKLTSFLMTVIIGLMIYSVIRRYVFHTPFNYLSITRNYFIVFIALGAAYTLRSHAFINVDIVQRRLSLRMRAIVDVFTSILFFLFCLALFITTARAAAAGLPGNISFSLRLFRGPSWMVNFLVCAGMLLLLLQGLAKLVRDLVTAITGREMA